jgi:AcrR family transcriptional regulator
VSERVTVTTADGAGPGALAPEALAPANRAPRRRGRPGYDLEAVLRVAVEVFNERGYDGASMEDLSKRLGIAKSGIYHHVSGKEELLRMALDRALDGLWEAAERARSLDEPAIVRLETLVRDAVGVLVARLPYVTLLLRVRGNTPVEREALARRRAFDGLVASLVEEAERDGDIRADIDPRLTARLLFGTVNSIVEWYRPASAASAASLADAVSAIAFDGLRVRR